MAVARGAHVVVAGPRATHETFGFDGVGCEVREVEIAAGPRPLADLRAARTLRTALADRDVVHAHGLRAGFLAGVAKPRGAPFVVTWHNAVLARGPLRAAYAVLERLTARRADVTLCVSGDLVTRVRALGGRDVRLAPVGSAVPARSARSVGDLRRELGVVVDAPLVLAIGRLAPQKGFDVLVRAAALLRSRDPAPLCVIAGDGPLREELAELISDLHAPVVLLGWREDTGDLLAAADLVVMSSRWEGSPLSAHETLLAGRPLVATAVGGLPELLGGGVARLVPSENPSALAKAIRVLLDDPAERVELGMAGHRRGTEWPDAVTAARGAVDVVAALLEVRR